ncbi:MAG: hypothetical protein WAP57_00405 [Aquabacterium commune]|jgi:hypothetical protein|nr:hypothetical protein [Aquabacterium sp.]MBT9611132.1 hypothetical protein [Aquabacterium sp.]
MVIVLAGSWVIGAVTPALWPAVRWGSVWFKAPGRFGLPPESLTGK